MALWQEGKVVLQAVWLEERDVGIFLASGFSCSQAESTPAHLRVTPAVGWLSFDRSNIKTF